MAKTFIITEKQDINSCRDGRTYEAKSLTAAKRVASAMQLFRGTVMTIEDTEGMLLCYKRNGSWYSVHQI